MADRESGICGGRPVTVKRIMAEVKLVNIKKIYPHSETKKKKKVKKGEVAE